MPIAIRTFKGAQGLNFDLEEHLNVMFAAAKENYVRDGALLPAFLIYANDEMIAVTGMESTPKPVFQAIARQIARGIKAERVIVVSEAWMVKTFDRSEEKIKEINDFIAEHGSLETYPDRGEYIIVLARDKDQQLRRQAQITRREDGTPQLTDKFENMDPGFCRFTDGIWDTQN